MHCLLNNLSYLNAYLLLNVVRPTDESSVTMKTNNDNYRQISVLKKVNFHDICENFVPSVTIFSGDMNTFQVSKIGDTTCFHAVANSSSTNSNVPSSVQIF